MKIYLYLIIIAAATSSNSFAQKDNHFVIAAAGEISKSSTIVLEWTVGETAIETVSSSSSLYTQGFHQPSIDVQRIGSSDGALVMKNIVRVFPNPTTSVLNIQLDKVPEVPLLVTLVDANGRVLINNNFPPKSNVLKINVSRFAQGTYFLRITDIKGSTRGEFKVIKTQ